MKHLIDKDVLVAELNRLIAELVEEGENTMFEQGRISAFEDAKMFINYILEVKEVEEEPVSNDLEEAAKNHKSAIHIVSLQWTSEVEKAFKAGAEWQKEQTVKKVDLEKELIIWHRLHFKKEGTFKKYSGFYLANSSQLDLAKHFFELGLKAKSK